MSTIRNLSEQLAKLLATVRAVEGQADNGELFADTDPERQRSCDLFDAMSAAAREAENTLQHLQSQRGAAITLLQRDDLSAGMLVALDFIGEFSPAESRVQGIASSLIAELGVYGVRHVTTTFRMPASLNMAMSVGEMQ